MSHITADEIIAANVLGIARGVRDAVVASATSTGSTRATMQRGSGNIPQLMAALRNMAIGLLRGAGHTNIVESLSTNGSSAGESTGSRWHRIRNLNSSAAHAGPVALIPYLAGRVHPLLQFVAALLWSILACLGNISYGSTGGNGYNEECSAFCSVLAGPDVLGDERCIIWRTRRILQDNPTS